MKQTAALAWLVGAIVLVATLLALAPSESIDAETVDAQQAATATRTRTPVSKNYLPYTAKEPTYTPTVTPTFTRTPTMTPTQTPAPRTSMAIGTNVLDNNIDLVAEMGFPWVKLYADWDGSDPQALVDQAIQRYPGVKILLRIDKSPGGARTGDDNNPIRADQLQSYLRGLVPRLRGKVQAYELFNEPNLKYEWNANIAGGSGMPSATGYTRILQAAYPVIKELDPSATVVSGGLSTAGEGGPGSVGDLNFIDGMYNAGARGSFDVLGIHPYGGPCTWDATSCSDSVHFRRAEDQRNRVVSRGDSDRKLWATEFGWLVDPRTYGYGTFQGRDCMAGLGGRATWVRSPQDVATQLSNAHRFAADNWPWMGGMFFFNFDRSSAGWVNDYNHVCDAPTWYSIVSKGNMPPRPAREPAFDALLNFARDYRLTTR